MPNAKTPKLYLDVQIAVYNNIIPTKATLTRWLKAALSIAGRKTATEMTLRFVDIAEITKLNHDFRHKNSPTNVLSFPFELPPGIIDMPLIGDIIVCLDIVAQEALEQNKTYYNHLTHMIIHGCLHLLGFDHIEDSDAQEMEELEIKILKELKINNPYENIY